MTIFEDTAWHLWTNYWMTNDHVISCLTYQWLSLWSLIVKCQLGQDENQVILSLSSSHIEDFPAVFFIFVILDLSWNKYKFQNHENKSQLRSAINYITYIIMIVIIIHPAVSSVLICWPVQVVVVIKSWRRHVKKLVDVGKWK